MSLNGKIATTEHLKGNIPPADGFSPIVEVNEVENGHEIVITDRKGKKAFTVKNGETGELPIDLLERYYSPSIVTKASGETIAITDASNVPPLNIIPYGKSTQNAYEGNQLLKYPFEDKTLTLNGTTYTDKGNGIINISGTSTATSYYNFYYNNENQRLPLSAGTYTLSKNASDKNINIAGAVKYSDGTTAVSLYMQKEKTTLTFTLEQDGEMYLYITVASDVTCNEDMIVMLNEGNTAKPWEPYVGGEQSPNINYPQEVVPHGKGGQIVQRLLSGNIFNASFRWYGNVIYGSSGPYTEENGVYKFTATKTDAYVWGQCDPTKSYEEIRGPLMFIPDNVTEISVSLSNKEFKQNMLSFYDENLICIDRIGTNNASNGYEWTFTVPKGAKYCTLRFGLNPATVGQTYETTVMVNYGTPLPYEPYTEQPMTYQTPNGFHGIPLGKTIPSVIANSPIHMRGVYWDKVEQQYYIGNTKNENGKDVQRILETVFDGSEDEAWVVGSKNRYQTHILGDKIIVPTSNSSEVGIAMCTHALVYTANDTYLNTYNGMSIEIGGRIHFYLGESEANIEAWVSRLSTNPITCYFVLKDPIVTDTSEEELAQSNALRMNYPNATIVNDANAHMEVEYVADTKCYVDNEIDKKFNELAVALVSQ